MDNNNYSSFGETEYSSPDNIDRSIIVNNKAIPFILLQRTELFKSTGILSYLSNKFHSRVLLESFMRKNEIKKDYIKIIFNEYLSIREYLPKNTETVLDIGCGVALLDLFLFRHYLCLNKKIRLFLMDKSRTDSKIFYGYKRKASYYNSLSESRVMLEVNGVPEENIVLVESNNETNFDVIKPDLVISLLSMGFHYPLDTYIKKIASNISHDGHLIVDIRKNTNGKQIIKQHFKNLITICEREKYFRILACN